MSVYRLVVNFIDDHKFEVLREYLDPKTNKVYSQPIYSSEVNPTLPHGRMGDTRKSVAQVLKSMGMDMNKEESKALLIRDLFELYREDLNSNSVSLNLKYVHDLIPKSFLFDTTYERWNALDTATKESVLKHLHDFHEEIDRMFPRAKTTRSVFRLLLGLPPTEQNPPPPTEQNSPPPTLTPEESEKLVEYAAARSVDSTKFRKAIMGILAALAAAGVVNYWPQLRQQIVNLKKVASEKRPTPRISSSRPSSPRRKKNTKRKSK